MSPRTKEQIQVIREQSKSKILDAALLLFSQKGYAATTVRAIAETAGVSKGLLYNYFAGKQDLLHGIVNQAMDIGDSILTESATNADQPIEMLVQIIDGVFHAIDTNRPFWKLLFQLSMQDGVIDLVRNLTSRQQQDQLAATTAVFREMGLPEPEKEAYLFAAILDGMAIQYVSMPAEYPLSQQIDYLIKRYKSKKN